MILASAGFSPFGRRRRMVSIPLADLVRSVYYACVAPVGGMTAPRSDLVVLFRV